MGRPRIRLVFLPQEDFHYLPKQREPSDKSNQLSFQISMNVYPLLKHLKLMHSHTEINLFFRLSTFMLQMFFSILKKYAKTNYIVSKNILRCRVQCIYKYCRKRALSALMFSAIFIILINKLSLLFYLGDVVYLV